MKHKTRIDRIETKLNKSDQPDRVQLVYRDTDNLLRDARTREKAPEKAPAGIRIRVELDEDELDL